MSTILSLKLLKCTDLNNSIGDIVNRGNMIHSKVGEGSRRIARSCKLHLHTILIFSLYTQCVQTMYNVCSTYKYFKYSSTYKYLAKYLSISTSTLGKLRKYLSKVQVLSNLYLSISTHVLGPMSGIMSTLYHHIYGFSMFNTLTKALHEIVSIIQIISSFFVFNKPLEIPSYIPLFSQ